MTVYQRIANPYQSPPGNAGSLNAPTPFYAPGEIGGAYNDQSTGRAYVRVKLDSGATSATPVGAVAANQTAYWKDRLNNIVTNDKRFCDAPNAASVNRIAGIFQTAVSAAPGINGSDGQPLQFVCDLCIQGIAVPVAYTGAGVAGDSAISDNTAAFARAASITAGTAPTSQVIGILRGAVVAGVISIDVSLGFIG